MVKRKVIGERYLVIKYIKICGWVEEINPLVFYYDGGRGWYYE